MTNAEIIDLAGHREVPAWVMKLVGDAIAKEREACAKVADEFAVSLERNYSEIIADKIRARGQE
jgi:hypothetical protein